MKAQDRWDSLIQFFAERYGVPWTLVKSQMLAESSGNPTARSLSGARGLMQLMPGTAAELGVKDSWNPEENIRGGVDYMSRMKLAVEATLKGRVVDPDDIWRFSLASYNCGFGYVRRALKALIDSDFPLDWEHFRLTLPSASIGAKRPRAGDVFRYVERILPPS